MASRDEKDAQLLRDIKEAAARLRETFSGEPDEKDEQLIRRMEASIQRSLELLSELKYSGIESKEVSALRDSTQTLLMQLGAFRRSLEH